MARRILPAQNALNPLSQSSLQNPMAVGAAAPENANSGVFGQLEVRWNTTLQQKGSPLFDWKDTTLLLQEVEFVNNVQEKMDEAAVRLAPSMLRIVSTIKANLSSPKAQRAWLAQHLNWDFRRISELCIVASSYGLLNPQTRQQGAVEMQRYGWSNALKLAYIRSPEERSEIWRRACAGRPRASYRDVLTQMEALRTTPLQSLPQTTSEFDPDDLDLRLSNIRTNMASLGALADHITEPQNTRIALQRVDALQQELQALKKNLKNHLAKNPTH